MADNIGGNFNDFPVVADITLSIADLRYLKLDQSTHQHVINGAPRFDNGIFIGNDDTKFILNGNDFELWVNGTKVQTWTIAVSVSYLLLETGFSLLLENGDKLVLEA